MKFLSLLAAGIMAVSAVSAQSVDDVINKGLDARGGLAKLKALESVVMEGTVNQAGNDITLKFYVVNNKGSRVEFSFQGQTGYTIITPTAGWTYNPFMGSSEATKMTDEQVKDGQVQLDLPGPFVDYKAKGIKAELLGKETVEGKDCFKIKLTRPNGKSSTYYLDATNYYVVRMIGTNVVNGSEVEITTDYSDFRKTPEGYVFPFKRVTPQGEVNFDKVTINSKVDDSLFKASN